MNPEIENIRYDLKIIASWIEPGSTILGLGCGQGDLLALLKKNKNVKETGIEIKESRVASCIEKGLSVLQGDINEEILDYPDDCFDYVILSQTLQQVYEPMTLLKSMMRVGKKGIVSFPNFCHWRVRLKLLAQGRIPMTEELPHEWYDTPNIRVVSIKDFRVFSKKVGFSILKEAPIGSYHKNRKNRVVHFLPNLFATYGVFLIGKGGRDGK